MKKAFIMGMMLMMAAPAFSMEQTTIKSCSTSVTFPGSDSAVEMKIDIVEEAGTLTAVVSQKVGAEDATVGAQASSIVEEKVRAGLTGEEIGDEDLNSAEVLISHALILTGEEVLAGSMSAGLDLKAVRSAKIYSVGAPGQDNGRMGAPAIVEAKDADGKDLGSFFGGFIVSPCK